MPPKKAAVVKEGDEKEMGGMMLRAVKSHDGKIVFKPVSQLDAKPEAKPQDEKAWLKEKQKAVVDARVQERRAVENNKKKASAEIYGRDEIYQGRSRGGGGGRNSRVREVEVSQYLQDLRLEEAQARSNGLHNSKPGQYMIIKESLDAEEAKHNQAALKAREKAYQRSQRRHGVHNSRDDKADDSDEAEHVMSEEEFKRLAQARAKAADNELARDGVKLRAPIPKREEEEAKARAKAKEEEDRRDRRQRDRESKAEKQQQNSEAKQAASGYVNGSSAEARAAAASEAALWAERKEQSEEIKLVNDKRPDSAKKRSGSRKGKGKGKGGGSKGGGSKGGGGRGGGRSSGSGRNASGRGLI